MPNKEQHSKNNAAKCETANKKERRESERDYREQNNFAVFSRRKNNQILIAKGAYRTINPVQFFVQVQQCANGSNCAIMRMTTRRQQRHRTERVLQMSALR